MAAIVETDVLLKLVLSAFAAGIGITSVFGLVIYGSTRFADLRRDGRGAAAGAFAVFTVVCLAAFAAAVVFGITVMTSK